MADKLDINISVEKARRALQSLETALSKVETRFDTFVKKLSNLGSADTSMRQLGKAADSLSSKLTKLGVSITKTSQKLAGLRARFDSAARVAQRFAGVSVKAPNMGNIGAPKFGGTNTQAKTFLNTIRQLDSAVTKLRSSLNGLNTALRTTATTFSSTSQAARTLKTTISSIDTSKLKVSKATGTERLKKSLEDTAQAADKTNAIIQRLQQSRSVFAQLAASIVANNQKLSSSLNGVASHIHNFKTSLFKLFPGLQKYAGLLRVAAASAVAFISVQIIQFLQRLGKNMYNMVQQTQSFINMMKAVTGSSAKASSLLERVKDVSYRLGISFSASVEGFRKFVAAANLSGVSVERASKAYEKVTEVLTVMHASTDQSRRAFLALEQMFSKGKVATEELRRQLGEVIPGAFAIMAESLGVTTQQLDGMLRRGEVTADKIIPFIDLMAKKFSGGLAEALKSPIVAIGRLNNAFEQLTAIAGMSFFKPLIVGLNMLSSAIAGSGIQALVSLLMKLVSIPLGIVTIGLAGIAHTMNGLGQAFRPLVTAIDTVINSFNDVYFLATYAVSKSGKALKDFAKDALKTMEKLGGVFKIAADSIKSLVSWLSKLSFTSKESTEALTGTALAFEMVKAAINTLVGTAVVGWLTRIIFRSKIVRKVLELVMKTLFGVASSSEVLEKALMYIGLLAGRLMSLRGIVGLARAAWVAFVGAIAAHPVLAGMGALLAIIAAILVYKENTKKAEEAQKRMNLTLGQMVAAMEAGKITAAEFAATMSKFKVNPNFALNIPLQSFQGFEDKINSLKDKLADLARSTGMNKTAAATFGQEIAVITGITNKWGFSISKVKQALKEEIQFIRQARDAIAYKMYAIAQEIQKRKEQGKSYKDLANQLNSMQGVFSSLNNQLAIKTTVLEGVEGYKQKLQDIKATLDSMNNMPKFTAIISKGDVDQIVNFVAKLESSKTKIENVAQAANQSAQALKKVSDWWKSFGENTASKTSEAANSMNEFASKTSNAVNTAVAKVQQWNATPLQSKEATVTIREKVIREESGGGGGGGTETQHREGGYFPKFASGITNTNKMVSNVGSGGDGGFKAILHKGEAVVPLSKGRFIPVELRTAPSPVINNVNVDSVNSTTPSSINITVNIHTNDAIEFRRSKKQIYQDLHREITKTMRSLRS